MFLRVVKRVLSDSGFEYHKACNKFLGVVFTQLDIEEFEDLLESDGVITLKVSEGLVYVINKQSPNKQVWIVSPVSGTGRYEFNGEFWANVSDGRKLVDLLTEELSQLTQKEIVIKEEV